MNFAETMRELASLGTEQNRKIYRRHGMPEPLFGVSFAHLGKLQKRIKCDPALAEALWASGNADACNLATMVADPARMSREDLERWAKGLSSHLLADLFAKHVVSRSAHALKVLAAWTRSGEVMVQRAGWTLLTAFAQQEAPLTDADAEPYLERIERGIHAAPNRVKEAMNSALISIGGARAGALGDKALAAAKRIGQVEVDHGETDCKTPLATEYILKMRAHRAGKAPAKKVAKPAAKAAAPAKKPAAKAKRAPASPARKTAKRPEARG